MTREIFFDKISQTSPYFHPVYDNFTEVWEHILKNIQFTCVIFDLIFISTPVFKFLLT